MRSPGFGLADPVRLRSISRLGLGAAADPAFDRIASLVERLVDVPVALVTVITDDNQYLPGQIGLPEPLASTRRMPLSHSLSRHVVEDGRMLVVTDIREDLRMKDSLSIRDLGAVAYAGVPLTDPDGLPLGTLAMMDREPRRWTPSEIALLVELGEICASELRLRVSRAIADEARRHAESAHDQLSLLGDLTEALAATMDVDEALRRLGRTVAGRLADWCLVALTDQPGTIRHASATHHDQAYAREAERLAELAGDAEPELRAMVRGSITPFATVPEIAALAGRMGFADHLITPIIAPVTRRTLGAVLLANGPGRPPFTDAELRTAAEIGRRAGLAVDNSRLYLRHRHMAEVLQHSMLPELPTLDGVELQGRYLPAQAGAAVGGDWYDAFAQPDGSVMLTVGDVSGHDIEAAATMGQVRNLVRGDAFGRADDPGPLLAQLDRALHGLQVPAAATAVLARLRRSGSSYEVAFANAGHPPPILLRSDGEVEVWWEQPEPLLGLLPRNDRSTHHRTIRPGSTLLLYTDGLVENPARLLDDGIARVTEVLRNAQDLPIVELCGRLVESATRRADDIAFLLVRTDPLGHPGGSTQSVRPQDPVAHQRGDFGRP